MAGLTASPHKAEARVNPRHADHEQAFAPEQITQPPAGDQQHREGQTIARHHQLEVGRPSAQSALHRGQGHIDHEEVKRRQEGAGQQHH